MSGMEQIRGLAGESILVEPVDEVTEKTGDKKYTFEEVAEVYKKARRSVVHGSSLNIGSATEIRDLAYSAAVKLSAQELLDNKKVNAGKFLDERVTELDPEVPHLPPSYFREKFMVDVVEGIVNELRDREEDSSGEEADSFYSGRNRAS